MRIDDDVIIIDSCEAANGLLSVSLYTNGELSTGTYITQRQGGQIYEVSKEMEMKGDLFLLDTSWGARRCTGENT